MLNVNIFDIVANYYTLQLGRCAVFSVIVMTFVLLACKLCRRFIFVRGLLWSLLLITPFIGRLRIFYENAPCVRLTGWWLVWCMGNLWVSRIYFLGMAVVLFVIVQRRIRLSRFVKGMEQTKVAGEKVFVCSLPITPFTTGVIAPKIVVPNVMLKEYGGDELRLILLHEKNHIRLGHLWFYFLWDVLHVLLWVNPMFLICRRYFTEDMEAVCDRVTIKKSGGESYDYGRLLLRSMKLLRDDAEPQGVKLPFAYAGEKSFLQLKRRIKAVAGYKGYRKTAVLAQTTAVCMIFVLTFSAVYTHSYPRYENMKEIYIYDMTGREMLVPDSDALREAVSYDDQYLYADSEKLARLLDEGNVTDTEVIVSFGGYYKLPGYGGGSGYAVICTTDLDAGGIYRVPCYISSSSDAAAWLFKQL